MWLYFCLTIPSLAQVHKYFGWRGVAAYLALTAWALLLLKRGMKDQRFAGRITSRRAGWLAAATLVLLLAVFLVGYPLAQSGAYGPGSDSDDSVNTAVHELVHGRYPYYARTYLGNAVHEMPGMLLLATPFVLLGNSAYMNLFWLAMFFAVCVEELDDVSQALLLCWVVLAFCLLVMQQVVTGGNQLANGLFTMVLLWWMTRREQPYIAALFCLSLSSRANFFCSCRLPFLTLLSAHGRQRAIRGLSIAAATLLAVTLPFILYDSKHFSPLEATDRLTRVDVIVPHLGLAIGIVGVLLTAWLVLRGGSLLANCAIVQAFLV